MPPARKTNGHVTLRLSFAPGFRLPELPGDELEPRVFTSTYFDSVDRVLAGSGATLRRRVEQGKSVWRLRSSVGSGLDLEAPGGPAGPPDELSSLLGGVVGSRGLEQVAKVRVRRSGVIVREGDVDVATIVVDDVAVLDGRRVVDRFKELRVEMLVAEDGSADRLESLLREAGAFPVGEVPRLAEVIGIAPESSDVRDASAPALLKRVLGEQLHAIRAHDPGTRLGLDPEELHDMRVATRRARAILRTARPLLDPAWTEEARSELQWLGDALGGVRDVDVFLARLRDGVARLDRNDRQGGKKLLQAVEAEREAAREALLEALSSERYQALLDTLAAAVADPPLAPVEVEVRDLAAGQFRRLRKHMRALPPHASDELIHRARIKGKRARYAAELAAAENGKATARFLKRAKRFQDVAGEHQDAVVAAERLRGLAVRSNGSRAAFAAGRLAEREDARRLAARRKLPKAWRGLERAGKKVWA